MIVHYLGRSYYTTVVVLDQRKFNELNMYVPNPYSLYSSNVKQSEGSYGWHGIHFIYYDLVYFQINKRYNLSWFLLNVLAIRLAFVCLFGCLSICLSVYVFLTRWELNFKSRIPSLLLTASSNLVRRRKGVPRSPLATRVQYISFFC